MAMHWNLVLLAFVAASEAFVQKPLQPDDKLHEEQSKQKAPVSSQQLQHREDKATSSNQENTNEAGKVMAECSTKLFEMLSAGESAAQKCETDGKFMDKVLGALRKDDDQSAVASTKELYEKCAQIPKVCADKVAPQVVEMLRFSGAAVSEDCEHEIKRNYASKDDNSTAIQCDKSGKFSEQALTAIESDNVTAATKLTQNGLVKCLGFSDSCAHQIAPVFVNRAVMRAMQEQEIMQEQALAAMSSREMPVLVVQPVFVIPGPPGSPPVLPGKPHKEGLSLLSMTVETMRKKTPARRFMRGAKEPALIQKSAHHRARSPWVSQLLVDLSLRREL